MKLKLITVGALLGLSLFSASCTNNGDGTSGITVTEIEYSVDVVGTATVSQIEYTATDGTVTTVAAPTLPFTVQASREEGQSGTLVVMGSASGIGNSITATLQDDPLFVVVPVVYGTETCEDLDPCTLTIVHTF